MKTIQKKMKTVEDRLKRLENISNRLDSFESFQRDLDIKDIAERNIQVAIESCLDIGKIIISQNKLSEPKDNKGIFTILSEAGIISQEILSFMLPMAGTRNILVHGYDKIDESLIYGILQKHLTDFRTFLQQVRTNYLT